MNEHINELTLIPARTSFIIFNLWSFPTICCACNFLTLLASKVPFSGNSINMTPNPASEDGPTAAHMKYNTGVKVATISHNMGAYMKAS